MLAALAARATARATINNNNETESPCGMRLL